MIELNGIVKRYGERTVLDIPRFVFESGRRYALLGANGSGKSTLLRILAGVLRPDAGTVSSDIPAKETGYLPQTPYAFDMTVERNVLLALDGEKDKKQLADAALARVGLAGLRGARGNRLSGGETQRMMLARMIAKPRRLLLFDEPTSATDISAEEQIERELLKYTADCGATLIFSSHEPGQALRLATDVLLLNSGGIAEYGAADEVLHSPKSEAAIKFLQHWRI